MLLHFITLLGDLKRKINISLINNLHESDLIYNLHRDLQVIFGLPNLTT